MDFENEEAKSLFFRYAIPCARVFVKRKIINQKEFDELVEYVSNSKQIPESAENNFKLALRMCDRVANGLGKTKIDEEVVRRYFWFDHDGVAKKDMM